MHWLNPKNRITKVIVIKGLIALVSLLSFSANIIGRSFSSDDVAQQAAAHDLTLPGPHNVLLGVDTYVAKIPIYLAFNAITHSGRTQLILESLFFTMVMVALFVVWWIKIAPKRDSSWLVFIWLLVMGIYWMSETVLLNTRNIDMGLMLLLGLYAIRKIESPPSGKRLGLLHIFGGGILAGGLTFEDPYFLFYVLLPIGVAVIIHCFLRKWRVSTLLGTISALLISLVIYRLLEVFFSHLHISIGYINQLRAVSQTITSPSQMLSKTIQVANAYLRLLGASPTRIRSNYWLLPAGILNLGVICLALSSIYHIIHRRLYSLINIWILVTIVATYGYMILTGLGIMYIVQYMFILIPITALLVALCLQRLAKGPKKYYRLAIALISMSLVLNIVQGVAFVHEKSSTKTPNGVEYKLISALNKNGITKSYGDYWIGDISYYLSDYKDDVLPTICVNGKIYAYPDLIDTYRFSYPSKKIGIITSTELTGIPYDADPVDISCGVKNVTAQLGTPQKIIYIAPSVNVLIYSSSVQRNLVYIVSPR